MKHPRTWIAWTFAGIAAARVAVAASGDPIALGWGAPGALDRAWQEVRYRGRTHYAPVAGESGTVLSASSRDGNSALLRRVMIDPRGIRIAWQWRVLEHPGEADPTVRARDDRAAGVLVIVRRSWIPGRTRALLYQWTPARPARRMEREPVQRKRAHARRRDRSGGFNVAVRGTRPRFRPCARLRPPPRTHRGDRRDLQDTDSANGNARASGDDPDSPGGECAA